MKSVKDYGAVGDGVHDDRAAIQALIDSCAGNDYGGDAIYFPPGIYNVIGGLVAKGANRMTGAARWAVRLQSPGVDCPVVSFDSSSREAVMEHIAIHGYNSQNASWSAVEVAENMNVHISDCNLHYGFAGLLNKGVDGQIQNNYIAGWSYGVLSFGANWYIRNKIDNPGFPSGVAAFAQGPSYAGNVGSENHLTQCDMSGTWQYALVLNDGNHKSIIACDGCVFGAKTLVQNGQYLLINCGEMSNIENQDPSCWVLMTNCVGTGATATGNVSKVNCMGIT